MSPTEDEDKATGELVKQVEALRRYALLLCGSAVDADDLVQETLVRVLAQLRGWRQVKDLRAYLFTTLHNAFIDLVRRRKTYGDQIDIEALEGILSSPAQQVHRVELMDLLNNIQKLSPEQRQVILLVGYEGMTYQETASLLDIPIGTVMSRLSRARETLRRMTDNPNGNNNHQNDRYDKEPKPRLRVIK